MPYYLSVLFTFSSEWRMMLPYPSLWRGRVNSAQCWFTRGYIFGRDKRQAFLGEFSYKGGQDVQPLHHCCPVSSWMNNQIELAAISQSAILPSKGIILSILTRRGTGQRTEFIMHLNHYLTNHATKSLWGNIRWALLQHIMYTWANAFASQKIITSLTQTNLKIISANMW